MNPYGQHYRAMPRLLRNSLQNDIFQYLLDEYMCLLRKGVKIPVVQASNSAIAECAGVNRGIVRTYIEQLVKLGLIAVQGSSYYINTDFLDAIVTLYNSKSTLKEKQDVASAFRNADMNRLVELGLNQEEDGNLQLLNMKGGVSTDNQTCLHIDNPAYIRAELPTYKQNCLHIDNPDYIQAELSTHKQDCLHIDKPAYVQANLLTYEQYCLSISSQFESKSDFISTLTGGIEDPEHEINVKRLANLVFDPQTDDSGAERVSICNQLWVLICRQFSSKTCLHVGNRNKYINKKENKGEAEPPYDKGEKKRESEDEMDDEELSAETIEETSERKNNFFEFKETELRPIWNERKHSDKPRKHSDSSYPMFPVDEIERIIDSVEYCVSDPLKLFINTVWWTLDDYIQESFEIDEDGEVAERLQLEGYPYPYESFQEDILERAYAEVEENMQAGAVEIGDDMLPVSFTEMFPYELLGKIFRWEKVSLGDGHVALRISKNGIYNVCSEKIQNVRHPETREERKRAIADSREYMRKLRSVTDLQKLTTVERIARECMDNYLTVENGGEWPVFALKRDTRFISVEGAITKTEWRMLQYRLKKVGIAEKDFLNCLMGNPQSNQYEQVTIQPCMFFADGIRFLNGLRGEKSIIDELE